MNRNIDPGVLEDVEEPHESWGEISSELSELSRPRIATSSIDFIGPRRLRGRPRKQASLAVAVTRRGRGRPRKLESVSRSEGSRSSDAADEHNTLGYGEVKLRFIIISL